MTTDNQDRLPVQRAPVGPPTPPEAIAPPPEIRPGFQDIFLSTEQSLARTQQRLQELSQEESQIAQQAVEEERLQARQRVNLGSSLALVEAFAPEAVREALDFRAASKRRSRELRREITAELDRQTRLEFRMGVLQLELVGAIGGDVPATITTPDGQEVILDSVESLAKISPELELNNDDRQFLSGVIEQSRRPDPETLNIPEERRELIQRMQRPGTNLAPLFTRSPHNYTAAELVEQVRALHRFQQPEGLTDEEVREIFRGQGLGDDRVQEIADQRKESIALIVNQMREGLAKREALKEELEQVGAGRVNSAIRQRLTADVLSRPGVLAMVPFEWYVSHINRPLAGFVVAGVGGLGTEYGGLPAPLGFDIHESFEQSFKQAKQQGQSDWAAYGYAFENWETSGLLKFGIEVLADPINFVGLGITSKILKPLPLIGKPMAAANDGYRRLAELPFDALRTGVLQRVPVPTITKSLRYSQAGIGELRKSFFQAYGKTVFRSSPEELRTIAEPAIRQAMAAPTSPDPMTSVGQFLLPFKIITAEDIQNLSRRLGTQIDVNTEILEVANRVMEFTDGFGITKFSKPNQSADALLRVFNLVDDTSFTKHNQIATWLTEIQEGMIRTGIRRLQGPNTRAILENLMNAMASDFRQATDNVISNQRYQGGIIASLLDKLTWAHRAVLIGGLDRWVTMPLARSYLVFWMYGPMNLLETSILKTWIGAGLNPLHGTDPTGMYHIRYSRFTGAPEQLFFSDEYNVSLGGDENVLRQLSNFAQTGQGNIDKAMRDTRPFTEKILTPKIKGVDIRTVSGQHFFQRVGQKALQNYWNRFGERLLAQRFPELRQAQENLINNLFDDLDLPVKDINKIKKYAAAAISAGDLNAFKTTISQYITPNNIRTGELADILKGYQEIIPEVRDLLIQKGINGELWHMGPAGIANLFRDELEPELLAKYFDSPQFFAEQMSEIATELDTFVPNNIDELKMKTAALGELVDKFGATIDMSLESAGIYAAKISDPAVADTFWNSWWANKIDPIVNTIPERIRQTKDIIRNQVSVDLAGMDATKQQHYLRFIDKLSDNLATVQDVRVRQQEIRNKYFSDGTGTTPRGERFKPPGRGRDDIFWNDFRTETNDLWDEVHSRRFQLMEEAFDAAYASEVVALPNPIDATERTLNVADVAQIFGVDTSQVTKYLYIPELMAIRGRREFTERIYGQANRVASRAGKTADDMGFTRTQIRAVYDRIIEPIRARVDTEGTSFANAQLELSAVREELIKLQQRQNWLGSDELSETLNQRIFGEPGKAAEPFEEVFLTGNVYDRQMVDLDREKAGAIIEHQTERIKSGLAVDPQNRLVAFNPYVGLDDEQLRQKIIQDFVGYDPDNPGTIFGSGIEDVDRLKRQLNRIGNQATNTPEVLDEQAAAALDIMNAELVTEGSILNVAGSRVRTDIANAPLTNSALGIDFTNEVRQIFDELASPSDADLAYANIRRLDEIIEEIDELDISTDIVDEQIGRAVRAARRNLEIFSVDYREALTENIDRLIHNNLSDAVETWFNAVNNDALQSIGKLAEAHPDYTARVRMWLRGRFPSGFIRVFRGKGAAQGRALQREYVNVSSSIDQARIFEAQGQIGTGQPFDSETIRPDIDGVLVRIEDILAIGSVDESELIIRSDLLRDRISTRLDEPIRQSTQPTTPVIDRFLSGEVDIPGVDRNQMNMLFSDDYKQIMENEIIPEIQRNFTQDFPVYDNANVISQIMKQFFPFWHYEAHRWQWLTREAIRHPGSYATIGKYRDNTDEGYIPVANLPLDVNPFRGTIAMGGMRRLFQRDYPEYYDNLSMPAEIFDWTSRFGFYPGAPVAIPLALFGAKRNVQTGELLPPWQRAVMDGLSALPGVTGETAQRFRDWLFPDRFREYLTATAASDMGVNGPQLLRKRVQGESLTDEEQRQWDSADRKRSIYSFFMEQTGIFRFNPDEKREFRKEVARTAGEVLDIDPDTAAQLFEDLRKRGLTYEEVFGAMPPEVNDAVRMLEGFHHWTGFGIVLAPSESGEQRAIVQDFWSKVDTRQQAEHTKLRQVENNLRLGVQSMRDWKAEDKRVRKSSREFIDSLRADNPKYQNVPMTLQERIEFAEEHSTIPYIASPMEELQNMFFSIELKTTYNWDTGRIEDDWNEFFAQQEAIKLALPEEVAVRFDSLIAKNDTALQQQRRRVYTELFRPYKNDTFDIVLANYDPEQQTTIRQFKDTINPAKREELRRVEIAPGESLIADFDSRLRNLRQNWRDIDPELDAWLNFFLEVSTFRSPTAQQQWTDINRQFNIRAR